MSMAYIERQAVELIGAIKPEAKAAWLAELGKPESIQAKGKLKKYNVDTGAPGFCCLGLFAEKVAGCRFDTHYVTEEVQTLNEETNEYEYRDEEVLSDDLECLSPAGEDVNESELLLQTFADQYGITAFMQNLLSHLNDGTTLTFYTMEDGTDTAEIVAMNMLLGSPTGEDIPMGAQSDSPRRARIWRIGPFPFTSIAEVIAKVPDAA